MQAAREGFKLQHKTLECDRRWQRDGERQTQTCHRGPEAQVSVGQAVCGEEASAHTYPEEQSTKAHGEGESTQSIQKHKHRPSLLRLITGNTLFDLAGFLLCRGVSQW